MELSPPQDCRYNGARLKKGQPHEVDDRDTEALELAGWTRGTTAATEAPPLVPDFAETSTDDQEEG